MVLRLGLELDLLLGLVKRLGEGISWDVYGTDWVIQYIMPKKSPQRSIRTRECVYFL